MSSPDAIAELNTLLSNHDFVFAIYYRGHWCPFCMSYIRTLESLTPSLKSLGGVPVIITSEVATHLPATLKSASYTGPTIVDPTNALAADLKKRGIIDIAISSKSGYKDGMAQPAILAMKKDNTVLESWAIVPSVMNMGGAKDRPDLNEVLENVQLKLKGEKARHASYTPLGMFALIKQKICGL